MAGTSDAPNPPPTALLAENLANVRERIERAAKSSGRAASEIDLVAVTKTHPIATITAAFGLGARIFGENYVQEALAKVAGLPQAEWHMIGSLQSNKAKQAVGKFSLIHTVDRERLASEIAKVAVQAGIVQDVLMQVHIGGEESKHGVAPGEAAALVEKISAMPGLRLRGLMSLPPLSEDERVSRGYFSELRELRDRLRAKCLSGAQAAAFEELSIGTSSDFEWAILEGATLVRVGTMIFGERPK